MKTIKDKSIGKILSSYEFSHKFYVIFACSCASLALSKVDKPDPRSVKGVEAALAYIDGKITLEEMKQAAASAAYDAATSASIHASAAASVSVFATISATATSAYD